MLDVMIPYMYTSTTLLCFESENGGKMDSG